MAKCIFCGAEVDTYIAERNVHSSGSSCKVACKECGQLHILYPVQTFKWRGATDYEMDNTTEDDWGVKCVKHTPLSSNEVLVLSATNQSGVGVDWIIHNLADGLNRLLELQKNNPEQTFEVDVTKVILTDEQRKEIAFEDNFFDYDWPKFACTKYESFYT